MQRLQQYVWAAVVVAVLGGGVLAVQSLSPRAVAAEEGPKGDHWRNFDGHWSYWHEGDKRWYYTDGSHWYYHDGVGGWVVYQFDKLFGVGFHHGDYKPPREVIVPKHKVFHP